MGLFNRKKGGDDEGAKKEKGSWRRPANTAFKQQRLKAWQPILTPRTVLPTLFIIGILFAPIGALLIWGSGLITEIDLDYTDCELLTSQNASNTSTSLTFTDIPSSKYSYKLRASDSGAPISTPQYAFLDQSGASGVSNVSARQCVLQFDVPADIQTPVLLYYKLSNFYQNHRRYVKSLNSNQLRGDHVSYGTIKGGDCKPLDVSNGKIVYPCGLIANSVFNDTFSNLTLTSDTSTTFTWSEKGIAWPGESKKYATSPNYQLSEIVPPPNWAQRYPQGYTEDNPPPDLKNDEHFQNWMRTAGLPTFTKLWGRNDNEKLPKGRYQIAVNLNYPVRPYKGTKSIVISTVSWIGGKNPFLGWAYVAAASLLVLLGVLGTIRHLVKPRKLGDMSLLSFNR
ncbi:transcription regulator [Dichomitus squalens LYAD-421 SS1]|uniref:transcription regulator n=1 Tax=Dichomitus squalens (strain LYAD-421) TaxID=732165 RepID=UPI0004411205|nr:transcription regulator [Dichomitus squalens LYAD-421 SS1]EJF62457.1 transcription regulator [Dichomitus squalens LYAD-421 SS1]